MKQSITPEGKCFFCGKFFSKAGINKHLKTHLEKNPAGNPQDKSYLVKIETDSRYDGSTPYFLSLWVDGAATMHDIDYFLRKIWLECCGHMSVFKDPAIMNDKKKNHMYAMELLSKGKEKEYVKLMRATDPQISMDRTTNKVFRKDLKLKYEYDFGSSTNLRLTVMDEYPFKADKDIVLLSRNEPVAWVCDSCKEKNAVKICIVHQWSSEGSYFCEKCAKEHAKKCPDFAEYASLPIVNSPRMGVCAYDGGKIDLERDVLVEK